ncbi:lipoyl synthase [Haliangium ochraceum]|uniref:Lipoyl synthase n=1 Tax=Haliangium ochraceum (strain DSM 14365 / JCM 11303 / SMP-2) TaxID=502025 RepID=D0LY54_HALO1|nr:lipoic acid synthetase [Haliangium ochraceum DSM 14365]
MPTDTPSTSERKKTLLPVVGDDAARPRRRHPPWIKVKLPTKKTFFDVQKMVHEQKLHTVCESASCPNIGECWSRRAITIMILGDICTRSCRFCDVATGRPLPADPDEPRRVAETLSALDLEHTVITCVDRDDLADGGAAHWAETIRRVKAACPQMSLEVLTGDFKGQTEHVDTVLAAEPDVFSHNLETVPRLSRQVRVQASYPRSYRILEHARQRGAVTKTGLMLGLGETREEVEEVLRDTRSLGVDIITLGQYLQPSKKHMELERYVPPEEFAELAEYARQLGFPHIEAGPLVRSSYHADGQAEMVRAIRADKQRAAGQG